MNTEVSNISVDISEVRSIKIDKGYAVFLQQNLTVIEIPVNEAESAAPFKISIILKSVQNLVGAVAHLGGDTPEHFRG